MAGMNTKVGWEVVGNGSCRETTAVNQLHRDGLRVGKRVQVVLLEEGRVQETLGGAGIDQRPNRYRGVVGKKEMDEKG